MVCMTPEANILLLEGAAALAQVSANGMRVDVPYLSRVMDETAQGIKAAEKRLQADPFYDTWRKRYGVKTNLGSREQLATVLYKDMGYECTNFTGTGRFAADESSLESVDHPFVREYVALEKDKKLRNTFLAGIYRETVDWYVHPFFNLHIPITIRSSSDSPNFQNLPIRDGASAELIRRCFIPRDGHCIVEVDFSGIEVRVAACYHKDPTMLEYIKDPSKDMHRDMAIQIYKLAEGDKTYWKKKGPGGGHDVRHAAKNMYVFPQFYGDYYINSAKSMWEAIDRQGMLTPDGSPMKDHLADQGISRRGDCDPDSKPEPGTFEAHMRDVEKDFWNNRFRVYGGWKRKWWDAYLANGGFGTLTGFYIKTQLFRNDVINYPVQGSAFHCLLWSLIRLQKWLVRYNMRSKIVGQIHDSIVADVHVDELDDYLATAKQIMTVDLLRAWKWLIVPLDIEAEVAAPGRSWYEKKAVEIAA